MSDHQFLVDLLILLALALASGLIFARLRLSPIIGYLVSGMIAGPYGLHLIQNIDEVKVIAEFGVILLLFTIGLEFSVTRLLRLKRLLLRGGLAQMLLSGAAFIGLGLLCGLDIKTAMPLAMALVLSSTAIVLKLLSERGEMDTAHGRMSLGILLAQDLAVVFFLVMLPLLAGQDLTFSLWKIVKVALLLGGLLVFSRYLLQPMLLGILKSRSQELFRITILALILVTAWLTGEAGLSLELGAFLAGLALAESPYAHQALSDILPFRDTFLAIFFVSIGILVNLDLVIAQWPLVLTVTLIVGIVKFTAAVLATTLCRYPLRIALLSGMLLFQAGEFSFVFLKEATDLALIPDNAYQVALAVIALTMITTPLIATQAERWSAGIAALFGRSAAKMQPEMQERTANLSGHVLIAGYGLSGRNVGKVLRRFDIPHLYVELNAENVSRGRREGEFIVYGDIAAAGVLHELGVQRAKALVLAINDPAALARTISIARQCNPELYILARTRYVAELEHLCRLGADEVIPDEFEASLQLGANLMRRFERNEGRILHVLSELRQKHYTSMTQSNAPSHGLSILEGGRLDYQAVPDDSPYLGASLAGIDLRKLTGVSVVGVIRQERTIYNPAGSFCIEQGDTLMLLGNAEDVLRASELLHGQPLQENS
ncbi:MAG: cation:proton antiporter [Desulfuromonadales bacterium]|nr:cation:proton antiporter [Desulfuromonadales bacterium]